MNIINKVTLKNMIKNKVRTIVTIIGIILSAAMICAVTILASSLQQYMIDKTVNETGNWYGNWSTITQSELESLKSDDKISSVIFAQSIGYSLIDDYKYKNARYIYFLWIDNDFKKEMPVKLVDGRLPENENEVILPMHFFTYENQKDTINIGQEITYNIGKRYCNDKILGQSMTYIEDEELRDLQQKKYTIVGFYERPGFEISYAPGYTAITVAKEDTSKECLYDAYFKTRNASDFYDYVRSNNFKTFENRGLLMYHCQFKYGSFTSVLICMSAIIISIIMFGSISLIYNSFSMSVSERTRQFGLLSSIGATKKQLKKSVLFEAISLSIIGIPLGILSGIGGIWITLMIICDKFMAYFNTDVAMRLHVSPVSIIVAISVSFITVLISAWIPSNRATKVSAIEAIRLNKDIKVRKKNIKSNNLVYKFFGFEGMVADKYYKRSKKKYRATIISLCMSIVLFVSTSSFCDYLSSSVKMADSSDKYDIVTRIYPDKSETDESDYSNENYTKESYYERIDKKLSVVNNIFKKISNADNIEKSSLVFIKKQHMQLPVKYIKDDFIKSTNDRGQKIRGDFFELYTTIYFVDDDTYKNYVKEKGLNESEYYDMDNPRSICYINDCYFDHKDGRYKRLNLLKDTSFELVHSAYKEIEGYNYLYTDIDSSQNDGKLYAFYQNMYDSNDIIKKESTEVIDLKNNYKIGYTTYDKPTFVSASSQPAIIIMYPQSLMSTILKDEQNVLDQKIGEHFGIFIVSNNHKSTYESIKSITRKINFPENWDMYTFDRKNEMEIQENALLVVNVFSYGFITLITLIAVANVFNTISTNILLRKKDFAMLKSVGMTNKGFNKMLRFECILYGIKSLILGLPVAICITFLIYLAVQNSFDVNFTLPYRQIIISILSVFLVVFITMMYAIRKIKKEDPIDNLRNDNI